ncbi:uncharacterized protein LOC110186156 [Drosophila serrata]|uniref:uncharacterized protein LOC110186156 n=1 Tax=Drosophila serrata TaxID=7274 RepID=UPI000A1D2D76|nr:uncharacterized protein LOC110186156 [Drosophila serrata]
MTHFTLQKFSQCLPLPFWRTVTQTSFPLWRDIADTEQQQQQPPPQRALHTTQASSKQPVLCRIARWMCIVRKLTGGIFPQVLGLCLTPAAPGLGSARLGQL